MLGCETHQQLGQYKPHQTIRRQRVPGTSIFRPRLSCSGILPDVGESLHGAIGIVAQLLQGLVDCTAGHA